MLTPPQVLDNYFLDIRHALLEIGAMFDRYDAAQARSGDGNIQPGSEASDSRRRLLQEAVKLLAQDNAKNRAETLLNLFSDLDPHTQQGENRTHPF